MALWVQKVGLSWLMKTCSEHNGPRSCGKVCSEKEGHVLHNKRFLPCLNVHLRASGCRQKPSFKLHTGEVAMEPCSQITSEKSFQETNSAAHHQHGLVSRQQHQLAVSGHGFGSRQSLHDVQPLPEGIRKDYVSSCNLQVKQN